MSIADRLPDEREFLEAIDMQLEDAETSATYWRMKYLGTWPGDAPNNR